MAWQQTDLDKLDAAIMNGVKSVTYSDGRKVDYHSLDEMRMLRREMKAEIASAASQIAPRTRVVVGRMRRR